MQSTLSDRTNYFNLIRVAGLGLLCVMLVACSGISGDNGRSQHEAEPAREAVGLDEQFHIVAAEQLGMERGGDEALQQELSAARRSDDPELAEEVTRIGLGVGAWDVAIAGARRWLELAPDDSGPRVALVRAYQELEDYPAVLVELRALVDSASDKAFSWQQAAVLLGQMDDDDQAWALMDELVATADPTERADALWGQSLLAWRSGETARAVDYGEASAQIRPDAERLIWTAQLAAGQEDYERALVLYERAGEQVPDDIDVSLARAEILRLLERPEDAHALLDAMPERTEVLFTRGFHLLEDDRHDEAQAVWRRMAGVQAVDSDGHAFFTARLAEALENNRDAMDWYARVEQGPFAERAVLRRAMLLGEGGQVTQARELLQELRSQRAAGGPTPGSVEQSWLAEAQVLQDAELQREALNLLGEALEALPTSNALLYSRALLAVAVDDLDLAEQDLRRMLQIEPDSALALNALGYTLTDRTNRHREAYRLIKRALEQEPDNPAILDSMGWVYFNLGQPEVAVDYLRQAYAGENNAEIAAHLGEVLWVLGERDEALDVLDTARQRYGEDEYLMDTRNRLGL